MPYQGIYPPLSVRRQYWKPWLEYSFGGKTYTIFLDDELEPHFDVPEKLAIPTRRTRKTCTDEETAAAKLKPEYIASCLAYSEASLAQWKWRQECKGKYLRVNIKPGALQDPLVPPEFVTVQIGDGFAKRQRLS